MKSDALLPKRAVQLVAFNVPSPPNYGGVIDVFYKIKALKSCGVAVHLHCFQYGRAVADDLETLCETVQYYERSTGILQHFALLPYIVQSRKNWQLLNTLQQNPAPIIFEGLHCCGFLSHQALRQHLKIVRMHNVEWQYYRHLARQERNFLKYLFFKMESFKLKIFEKRLQADCFLTISPSDTAYFRAQKPNIPSVYVPAFHGADAVSSRLGTGDYALFHGDLSVKDNEEAAIFLIEKVFSDENPPLPLVIAGLNPSKKLLAKANKNIRIESNLSESEMQERIEGAQIHLLWSFHSAGMKLKLLNALFKGRFCVVNSAMVADTPMSALCTVADTPEAVRVALKSLANRAFTDADRAERVQFLAKELNNLTNAQTILAVLDKIPSG
jgi:hypothetical protein